MVESSKSERVVLGTAWVLVCGFAVYATANFLSLALARLNWGFEIAYVEGSILRGAARWMEGLPYYIPPGPDFCAINFPPVFMGLISLIFHFTGLSYAAGRGLSIVATLGTVTALYYLLRRLGMVRLAACATSVLYLHLYAVAGTVFDAVMPDSLFIFMLVMALFFLARPERPCALIMGCLFAALAYYTKQTALFFFPFMTIALLWVSWRKAIFFALWLGAFLAMPWVALHLVSHGWYTFYTVHLPSRHYWVTKNINTMIHHAIEYFWPLYVVGIIALIQRCRRPGGVSAIVRHPLAWWWWGGLLAMVAVRTKSGSEIHGELPFYFVMILAGGMAFSTLTKACLREHRPLLLALGLVGMGLTANALYLPIQHRAPREVDRRALEHLRGLVHDWQASEERVWIMHHSFFLKCECGVDTPDLLGLADIIRYNPEMLKAGIGWPSGKRLQMVMPEMYARLKHGHYTILVRDNRCLGAEDIEIVVDRCYERSAYLWDAPQWAVPPGRRAPLTGTVNNLYPVSVLRPSHRQPDGVD